MYRRIILSLVALAVALIAPGLAHADMVTQWNQNATTVLMGNLGQGPQLSVPHLAMVHGAAYDAVNAIDGRHEGYLLRSRIGTPFDSKDAAAATGAYRVLRSIVPSSQYDLVDAQYALSLAQIPDGVPKTRGIAVGEAAGAAMIAARTADGRFGPPGFELDPPGPGVWEPTPPGFVNDPNAWLRNVTPFLIESSSQFRSAGPDPLTSRRYARDYNEVKEYGRIGDESERSEDQTNAARYWAENPPGTWSRIFRTLSAQEELSLEQNARLYAMLYLTAADALISVWDDKDHYMFWRPVTAIRRGDTDGNSRTEREDGWSPLITTPPYPEHPSGHAGLSGSIVATMQDFFRTDHIGWTDTNNAGLTRRFTRFSDSIEEVIDARVWSGIHFRNADDQGARIGQRVANWRERHYFRPVHP